LADLNLIAFKTPDSFSDALQKLRLNQTRHPAWKK
jgi:hypothetical protein